MILSVPSGKGGFEITSLSSQCNPLPTASPPHCLNASAKGPRRLHSPHFAFLAAKTVCVAFVSMIKHQVEGKLSCVHLISVWTHLQVILASTERAGGCPGRGEAGQNADSLGSDTVK